MRSYADFFVLDEEEKINIQKNINTYQHNQYPQKEKVESITEDFTDDKN